MGPITRRYGRLPTATQAETRRVNVNRAVPTEVKKLMGNPGKRALPKAGEEAEPELVVILPDPPDWLGEYGVKEWHRVGPELVKNKLLTQADMLTFAAYCANVDMLVEATLQI